VVGFPNIDALILGPGNYILSIVAERPLDLRGHIQIPLVLTGQVQVPQIVKADSAVVGGDQDLVLPGHRFNATDLAANAIFTPGGAHMNLRVVLELIRIIKYATAVVRSHHSELSVLAEVGSRYKLRLAIHLIPESHLLVGYIPQP